MKRFCITCLIAVIAMPFWAQAPNRFPYYIEDTIPSLMGDEIALMDSNEVESETLVPDTLPFAHPMPVFAKDTVLKAPSRQMAAQASACPMDSVVGRDVNGNYVSLKTYRYDDAGRTIETDEWKWVNGVKTGVTKSETDFYASGKTKMTASWGWDSNTNDWRGSSKNEYTYNTAGQTTLWVISQWYNGVWAGESRYTYTYDERGNKTASIYEVYDLSASKWVGSSKYEYAYDNKDRPTDQAYYTWNTSANDWVGANRNVYAYDANGNTILEHYYKSMVNGEWQNGWRKEYAFDANKNRTSYTYYSSYSNGSWVGNTKDTTMFYNGTKKVLWKITYKWLKPSKIWAYNVKQVYDYDAAGNTTEDAKYSYKNDDWAGTSRTTWTFVYTNKEATKITYNWGDGVWVNAKKIEKTYNAAKMQTGQSEYDWIEGAWSGTAQVTYAYDSGNHKTEEIRYVWQDNDWVNSTRKIFRYNVKGAEVYNATMNWSGTEWIFATQDSTYYEYHSSGKITVNTTYTYSGGAWIGKEKYEYTYNNDSEQTYSGYYKWTENDWLLSKYSQTEYYKKGKKTLEQSFELSSGVWIGSFKNVNEYDAADNVIRAEQYIWGGKDWRGMSKNVYAFDVKKNKTLWISYVWSDGEFVPGTMHEYGFNANNREILHIESSYIGNTWVKRKKYVHDYDAKLREILNNTYEWLNGDWAPVSISEKTYDEDTASKLRLEYAASYSDGVLQTYSHNRYHYACDPHAFLIRFLNWDGSLISEQNFDAGVTPSCDSIPVRPANDSTSYTFKAWSPAISPVTEATTYTADYDSVTLAFPISFVNYDGSELQSEILAYGKIPTYEGPKPSKPANDSMTYTFKSWSPAIVRITQAATYTATFDSVRNQYTVTFKDADGTTLESKKWDYGVTPTCTEPSKQPDAQYTYTFGGWDKTVVAVVADAEYTATYTTTTNQYTVTFKDADGTTLESKKWDYGVTPTCTEPSKQPDAQYTYTFGGWDKTVVAVVADAEYTATYTTTTNQYTVTFKDADGTTLESKKWDYGATPTCTEPSKQPDAQYTYTFGGWDKTVVAVVADAEYTATYTTTTNQYTVTFKDADGTTLESKKWDYGATPTCTEPTKPADVQYSYSFKAWTPSVSDVTAEATYTAIYDTTAILYTVTFANYDGKVLQSQDYTYGATPQYTGITPSRASNKEYAYTFKAWEPKIVPVTQNAVYTATYDSTEIESYVTILFLNYDSTLIYSQVVRYKRMPVYEGPTPTRKPSAHYTYTFKSWSPAISVALENTIYIAQYDSLTRYYSIRFVDYDGTILQSDELLYGETPFYRGAEPTREEDSEYTYTFDGWTPKIAPVDEDVAYVATYKAEPRNTADRHPYADGPDESKPMYNILGNPVDSHYRGIVIQGGRKFLR